MILKLFRQNYFMQLTWLIVFSVLIWLPAFLSPQTTAIFTSPFLKGYLIPGVSFLNQFIAFILILAEAFLLTYLFSRHQLTHKNNFLPGFLFVLFSSRTPEHLQFLPSVLALPFILLGLYKLLDSFKSNFVNNYLLSTSIYFSIGSLFVPSVLLLFLFIWISLILFQSFEWRSIPITIIGLVIPYAFIAFYYFWFNHFGDFLTILIQQKEHFINRPQLPETQGIIEFFVAAILVFISGPYILQRVGNQVISIRKKTYAMYWLLGLSVLISVFNAELSSRELVFIPLSGILGFYFSSIKKTFWADLFVSSIFLGILVQNYRILFYA